MSAAISTANETVYRRGRPVTTPGIQVSGSRLVVDGKSLKIARVRDEWYDELKDPEQIVERLKSVPRRPDLFTFWQRLPDTKVQYSYRHEWENLSAIPLQDFGHWWNKQIRTDTRKKIKRPEKRGVTISEVLLTDDFVRGVMEIFNETPIRRGRRFWHYGKDFDTLKSGLARDLSKSKFIGAYYDGQLIGFVKLVFAEGRFANPGLIVSKIAFRKTYLNNALLAKAVELCTAERIPYLTYTNWRRGTQAEFLIRHGFEKISVPRYWIPLTVKGRLALKLGLHRGVRSYVPDSIWSVLLTLRKSLYERKGIKNAEDDV